MIGLDTNILLRLLVNDDQQQSDLVRARLETVMADEQIYISVIVLVETCWVLRRTYQYRNAEILRVFRALLETENLVFQDAEVLAGFFQQEHADGDIPDHLISLFARHAGCRHTVTFDKGAANDVPGMELLS